MTIPEIHTLFLECSTVSIDTRKISKDALFIALKGAHFDANTFAKEALDKGAKYVIVDNPDFAVDKKIILVKNTLETLQELSKYHRMFLGLRIIALTGSNGKTTTKELIHAVLNKKYRTIATEGNLNNHIGVPITLLRLKKDTEIGIIEMGANHQKEIEFLCSLALPDYAYITNFGKAHLEGFGGIEGVIKGKSEMYEHLQKNNKLVFVNSEDPIQFQKTNYIKRFTFSTLSQSDVTIHSVIANPMVTINYKDIAIKSHLIGLYNANNINAALCIGIYFKVADDAIKEAIENYIPENNRSQLIQKNDNQIILDAYNANPSSMNAAIANFIQLENKNKIAILGDMFELGNESLEEHKKIISLLQETPTIKAYCIGKDFYYNKINSPQISFFKDFDSFSLFFLKNIPSKSTLLIKGSRGMSLEKTLQYF